VTLKTISADFNAMTGSDSVRLTTRGSEEGMRRAGVRVGDWAWLTDGDLIVGARIEDDPSDGLVGIPAWDTLVHLDDEGAKDLDRIWSELSLLLDRRWDSARDWPRLFQVLTILEAVVPGSTLAFPNELTLRRAGALYMMRRPELALLEIEDARRGGVEPHEQFLPLYLDILRRTDLRRARGEVEARPEPREAHAMLLASYIAVFASIMESPDGDPREPIAMHILDLADRFESAPGREQVPASILARVWFHRGFAQMCLGRVDDAHRALESAYLIDPLDAAIRDAQHLVGLGPPAWSIAARVGEKPFAA
jgi:hypothetical protein